MRDERALRTRLAPLPVDHVEELDRRVARRREPYEGKLTKNVAVGFISHRTLQVESAESIAADIRLALEYIEPEHLVLSSDCGCGRQGITSSASLTSGAETSGA